MAMTATERTRKRRKRLGYSSSRSEFLMYEHGITIEQFQKIVEEQEHTCPICKRLFINMSPKNIHVDHDHVTGKIRGVLCVKCNRGIGFLGDNVEIIKNAILYLQRSIV